MQPTVNLKDALLQAGIPVGLAVSFENSAAPSAWIVAIEDFDPEYNLAYGRESGEMIYLYGYNYSLHFLLRHHHILNYPLLLHSTTIYHTLTCFPLHHDISSKEPDREGIR